MRIDAILFDLGGVMIELAGVERMLEWSPSLGSTDELWHRWLGSAAVRAYVTGRTNHEAYAAGTVAGGIGSCRSHSTHAAVSSRSPSSVADNQRRHPSSARCSLDTSGSWFPS